MGHVGWISVPTAQKKGQKTEQGQKMGPRVVGRRETEERRIRRNTSKQCQECQEKRCKGRSEEEMSVMGPSVEMATKQQ